MLPGSGPRLAVRKPKNILSSIDITPQPLSPVGVISIVFLIQYNRKQQLTVDPHSDFPANKMILSSVSPQTLNWFCETSTAVETGTCFTVQD